MHVKKVVTCTYTYVHNKMFHIKANGFFEKKRKKIIQARYDWLGVAKEKKYIFLFFFQS